MTGEMTGKAHARAPILAALVAFGCHPDCDWEAELERLMIEGSVDCGDWDPELGDEALLQCASDAEAAGLELRFDFEIELGRATGFSRAGKLYVASRTDKFVKTDDGIEVNVCAGSLPDALDEIRAEGICGEELCNVCPMNQECLFPE